MDIIAKLRIESKCIEKRNNIKQQIKQPEKNEQFLEISGAIAKEF